MRKLSPSGITKYANAAPPAKSSRALAMNGPTNFRSFGRKPGDTNLHVCHSTIGNAITRPTTAATFSGTVSPSVGS